MSHAPISTDESPALFAAVIERGLEYARRVVEERELAEAMRRAIATPPWKTGEEYPREALARSGVGR